MLHISLQAHLPQVKEILRKHGVKNAYVFGSAISERFNQESDIDLLITFLDYSNPLVVGQSIWELEDELEQLISRKIDLLTERSLKNPYFIQELNNTKELIYEYQA